MIVVEHVTRLYGKKAALHDVSFQLEEGKIVGLLGSNGAGKSTLLKAIAGLVQLNHGTIRIDGVLSGIESKNKVAYLPDNDVWYDWMTIADTMAFMQDFYADWNADKAKELLSYFQFSPEMRVAHGSKGMRAKHKLLLALSRQAKYLLLDEPLSGIDIWSREDLINALIRNFIDDGQTVLISTHEIREVEPVLDDVLILKEGRVVLNGNVEQLKAAKQTTLVEMIKEVYAHEGVLSTVTHGFSQ